MGLTLTTPPGVEPLTLDEAKAHLRIELSDSSEDTLVESLMLAARRWAETELSASLITQTWKLTLPGFPWNTRSICLERGPVQSITSIKYLDSSNVEQTLDPSKYLLETRPLADEVWLTYLNTWPVTVAQRDAVRIVYVAGYGDAGTDVPEDLRRAMLLRLGDLYRNREAQVIGATVTEGLAMSALLGGFQRGLAV